MTQMSKIDWLTDTFAPISLSELNAKAEMMRRTDNKYVVSAGALQGLVPLFNKAFDILEIENRRSFNYATDYFDTPDRSSYFEHHRGMRKRMKVRVRRYLEANLCFLEVKVKGLRNMTEKFRMPYAVDGQCGLSDDARDFVEHTYHRQYDRPFGASLTPVLSMSYQRITLVARAGGERMTIDTELKFNANGQALSTGPDVFILEAKSENGRGFADRLLREAGERPIRRCSKYCIGLAATRQVSRYNHFLPALRKLGLVQSSYRRDPQAGLIADMYTRPAQPNRNARPTSDASIGAAG